MSTLLPSSPELEPTELGPATTLISHYPSGADPTTTPPPPHSPTADTTPAIDPADELETVELNAEDSNVSVADDDDLPTRAGTSDVVQSGASSSAAHPVPAPISIPNGLPPPLDDPVGAGSESAQSTSSFTLPAEPSTPKRPSAKPAKVWGVCLVGFDHALGPTVEWASTASLMADSELHKQLPFLALPDGAHLREEDYSYFHLLLPSISKGTIFGVSCNRQIQADQLINKGKEVTRSTVQKAIVVLASKPIFGPLRDKLGVITRAYFAQKDFEEKSILDDLAASFTSHTTQLPDGGVDEEGRMYMGTSLRELVHKFRFRTLMLLKLLMLQRKVMFYAASTPVEQLCTFQYSLVALIPELLTQLEDAASPELDERSKTATRPTSLRTSDKASLLRYLGLPLNVFGKGSIFQPYLPLQQLDMLKTHSFLVGTTNSIFQQQRDCPIDVLINLDTASVEVLDPKLVPLLNLTAADRKWIDEIVQIVDGSYSERDPATPIGMSFVGSEDFLRAKFEDYICSLLACVKFGNFLKTAERGEVLLSSGELDGNMMSSFNDHFIKAFTRTPAFELWDRCTDSVIFDLVEPKHPMAGKTNPIEDVGIRLSHGLHDLHLEENLAPAREAIARGVASGSDSIFKTYSFIRSDLSKRQKDFAERRGSRVMDGGEGGSPGAGGVGDGIAQVGAAAGGTLLAGVDVAQRGVGAVATGIGSFLSTGRKQLFAAKPQAADSRATSPLPPATASADSSTPAYPPSTSPLPNSPAHTTSTTPLPPTSAAFSSFLRPLSTASFATTNITPPIAVSQAASAAASTAGGFFTSLRRGLSDISPGRSEPTVTAVVSPTSGVNPGGWTSRLAEQREERVKKEAEAEAEAAGGEEGVGEAAGMGVGVTPRDLDAEWEAQKAERERERDKERRERRRRSEEARAGRRSSEAAGDGA